MYEGNLKNGDLEKFYGRYYGTVPVDSTKFLRGLSRSAATLLATKVADCLVAYCKRRKNCCQRTKPIKTVLSEREKAGLPYLGGYVLHNLYIKHTRTNSVESQQAMALLKAVKLGCINDSEQRLTSS